MFDDNQRKPNSSAEKPRFASLGTQGTVTETIDIGELFTRELTESGSFDIGSGIWASTFGKVLQAIPIPTLLVRPTDEIVAANQAVQLICPNPEGLCQARFSDFFESREAASKVASMVREVFSTRKTRVVESMLKIQQQRFWTRVTLRCIRIAHERFVLVLIEDLTQLTLQLQENKRLQDELQDRVYERTRQLQAANEKLVKEMEHRKIIEGKLRRSERQYRTVFKHAGIGIYLADSSGGFMRVNGSLARMLGYSAEELLALTFVDVTHPEDREKSVAIHEDLIHGRRESCEFEKRYVRCDGSILYASVSASGLYSERGIYEATIGIVSDVTGRRRAEEARIELERRLFHAQKLESMGLLAGGIAHDFNNLLSGMLGNLEIALGDSSMSPAARGSLMRSVQAGLRAADLTRQMLAYSGKGKFILTQVRLDDLVEEGLEFVKTSLATNATLSLDLDHSAPPIEADPGQIHQVVVNLLMNASDAIGGAAGRISVSTGLLECDESILARSRIEEKLPAGFLVFLQVADTGCGMDETTQRSVFDPFFTTKFKGRGLGMSAVLGIVRGHGGAILLDSVEGMGTTVTVLFPPSESDRRAVCEKNCREEPNEDSERFHGASRTILLVDDERIVREVCTEMLESFGFKVIVAADGREGVELFKKHADAIDCALLDLSMPGMDGIKVLGEIRDIRPNAKAILTSGFSEEEATTRFADLRLLGFLQKPYRMQALLDALNRAFPHSLTETH